MHTKDMYDFVVIGGDTGLDPEIGKTIHELHLEERVKLLGRVSDQEVATWYRGAQALVAFSQTEGFCLPAVEAMASSCPVIYAQDGALPEIVGQAGIGVSLADIGNMHIAFANVTQSTTCKLLARHAASQIKKYQWSSFAQKVHAILYT
jgi:glycosyltransferase involved in cell wall biosynthesis